MTREEQIKQAANDFAMGSERNYCFRQGAEWADQHPTVFNECVNEISADYHAGYNQGREDERNISPWISVEDRLPKERNTYFLRYTEEYDGKHYWSVDIGHYEPQRGWSNCPNNNPTHWMPIPPIEKGGEK